MCRVFSHWASPYAIQITYCGVSFRFERTAVFLVAVACFSGRLYTCVCVLNIYIYKQKVNRKRKVFLKSTHSIFWAPVPWLFQLTKACESVQFHHLVHMRQSFFISALENGICCDSCVTCTLCPSLRMICHFPPPRCNPKIIHSIVHVLFDLRQASSWSSTYSLLNYNHWC